MREIIASLIDIGDHISIIFETRGIDWPADSEKSKWLRMPEWTKRCYINNHRLLRKRDLDCDATFVVAGLVTKVYKNYPETENTHSWDVYDGILEKKFMHLPPEKSDSNHPLWREQPDPYERSDEEWVRYFRVITRDYSEYLATVSPIRPL